MSPADNSSVADAGFLSGPGTDALDPAGIFRHLDLKDRRCVVVAVSGGSDSLSLLHLFKRFLDDSGNGVRPVAVTVDHRLRAGSAEEARRVEAIASALGIEHRIVSWDGPKPHAGIPAAAREARHRLLAQAAGEAGTDIVLTGHTINDQGETVQMRRSRGQGRGQAGVPPATLFDGRCWFVRPLLGMRRCALRDYLAGIGQDWIDDPTNADPAYERARMRAALGSDEAERLGADARAVGRLRTALGVRAARVIEAHAGMPVRGLLRFDRALADAGDTEAAAYALRILLACAGGMTQLPDEARVAALFERLKQINFRASLSRSVIESRPAGIFLYRERRGLPAAMPVAPGMWDGRYRIEGAAAGELAPADPAQWAERIEQEAARAGLPGSLAKAAFSARPALLRSDDAVLVDECDNGSGAFARPVVAPWARYLPAFDIAPAAAAAGLIGADSIPAPPFLRHIDRDA